MNITIIYQDPDLLIVNKPSGLLCVPGLVDPDNLHDRVKQHFANARVIHRLDMATSGLVIFALHYEAQKAMGRLFEQRQMQKQYTAIVHGQMHQSYGEIHSPLICDWPNRPLQKVDWLSGKASLTYYRLQEQHATQSRVELHPITGRTHQLRVHMLQIGHPILGDNLYNLDNSQQQAKRLLLHATQLNFKQPLTGENLEIRCEPDF